MVEEAAHKTYQTVIAHPPSIYWAPHHVPTTVQGIEKTERREVQSSDYGVDGKWHTSIEMCHILPYEIANI